MSKPTENREERVVTTAELRVLREEGDGAKPKIAGYAAVFDSLSEDLGGFREKIRQGAFKTAIADSDTRALWNHDRNFVLGRKSAGTLRMAEDSHGLKIEVDAPDTQWARDLMVSIERGDVNQMSFGFKVRKDTWEESGGATTRTLDEVERLYDVSPVTFPAYPDTTVALRSMAEWRDDPTPSPEPAGADAPADQGTPTEPMHRVTALRRRLELKARTITTQQGGHNG